MDDQEKILERASNISFRKLDAVGGDIAKLAEPFKTVAIIYSAQGVIDNGGLYYFFESDWPHQPPYSLFIDAYRRIGRTAGAEALDRAVKSFGVADPERNRAVRNRILSTDVPMEWDDSLCGDELVWRDLAKWIRLQGSEHFG